MGSVVFMPSEAIGLVLQAVYFAHFYDVPASISWYVMACILAVLLSIAMPPAPGSMMTVYTIMLAQMGIPAEALVYMTAMGIVKDFIDTAGNVMMRDLELTGQAQSLGLLDHNKLHRP